MPGYFEGWYYKQQNGERTLALIPALHKGQEDAASLQIITDDASYSVPFRRCHFDRSGHCFLLGNNRFTRKGLSVDCHTSDVSVVGELVFDHLTPLESDIMGPFRFAPFMQCRHSVFSMSHRVNGAICLNGRDYRFCNGTGYMEGDRGHSFPERYLWTQCSAPEASIMISAATIPYLGLRFTGVISAVVWHGREIRLATYQGAKLVSADTHAIVLSQKDLYLSAELLKGNPRPLKAPVNGKMQRIIRESAACKVRYRLLQKDEVLFDFINSNASFEDAWDIRQDVTTK